MRISKAIFAGNVWKRKMRLRYARSLSKHTPAEWNELKTKIGRCVRCATVTEQLEKDHIVPIYQAGSDGIENLQPVCAFCNRSKGPETMNWIRFRELFGWDFKMSTVPIRQRGNDLISIERAGNA